MKSRDRYWMSFYNVMAAWVCSSHERFHWHWWLAKGRGKQCRHHLLLDACVCLLCQSKLARFTLFCGIWLSFRRSEGRILVKDWLRLHVKQFRSRSGQGRELGKGLEYWTTQLRKTWRSGKARWHTRRPSRKPSHRKLFDGSVLRAKTSRCRDGSHHEVR